MSEFLLHRPRRMRSNPVLREVIRETRLSIDNFIQPIFVKHGNDIKNPIAALPDHFQFSVDRLGEEIAEITSLGIKSIILFGIPEFKDVSGSDPLTMDGIIPRAIKEVKRLAPDLLVIADVCMCEYTDHGHCGVIKDEDVDNDLTLPLIAEQAVIFAKAGADIIAPSGMMDNAVLAVREALDKAGFAHIPILGYSIKYASSLYGPFRMAAEGVPQFGNRKSYQADYCNANEALKEVALDVAEGVDMLMVKPAHTYLDIIYKVKLNYPEMPLIAYHTSGEYAFIKSASKDGLVEEKDVVIEVLTAIKRAGADLIISYYTKYIAQYLS